MINTRPTKARATVLYHAYSALTRLALPFAYRKVARKLADAGVREPRIRERLGYATLPRANARLIWFHAASVGESLSILGLINRMRAASPDLAFLITSGTATSAAILAKRMPDGCVHQFAPLDSAPVLRRFLAHWHPDLGVFVESELWPQMLVLSHQNGTPLALLNARLSARSVKNWQRFGKTARYLLGLFSLIIAQTDETTEHLRTLGANPDTLRTGQDLKAIAGALPYDNAALDTLKTTLANRPVWVASSTHKGEEEQVLDAHKRVLADFPDALLILVPRHPERAPEILEILKSSGLNHAQRTKDDPITSHTQIYLADTLGETGLWYALAPIVFLGGSLMPIGGHNPFEPAYAGATVLFGPHITNMTGIYQGFELAGGCQKITSGASLANALLALLSNSDTLAISCEKSREFALSQQDALAPIIDDLFARLK